MIRDAIRDDAIEIPHGDTTLRSEKAILLFPARLRDECLYEEPTQVEPSRQSSIIAREPICRRESLESAFVAVGQYAFASSHTTVRNSAKIERTSIVEAKTLNCFEHPALAIFPEDSKMKRGGISVMVEIVKRK